MDLPCCAALRCAARCILRSAHGVQAVATWPQRIWSRRRHGPQARRRLRHKCRACATKSIKSAHSVWRAHQCCTHVCRTFCAGPFMCRTLHSSRATCNVQRATCNVGVPHSSAAKLHVSCMLQLACCMQPQLERGMPFNVARCRCKFHAAALLYGLLHPHGACCERRNDALAFRLQHTQVRVDVAACHARRTHEELYLTGHCNGSHSPPNRCASAHPAAHFPNGGP